MLGSKLLVFLAFRESVSFVLMALDLEMSTRESVDVLWAVNHLECYNLTPCLTARACQFHSGPGTLTVSFQVTEKDTFCDSRSSP